ncbi:MAG: hypothetical protein LBM27_05300, partial [Lactobacillaceae bacterium]|nr:hypothetical protein [Lactobacillaceae bacterium]
MENDQIIAFVPFKKIELPLEIITDMKFTVFAPLPDGSRGEYERLYFSLPTSDALKINKIIHPITSV